MIVELRESNRTDPLKPKPYTEKNPYYFCVGTGIFEKKN